MHTLSLHRPLPLRLPSPAVTRPLLPLHRSQSLALTLTPSAAAASKTTLSRPSETLEPLVPVVVEEEEEEEEDSPAAAFWDYQFLFLSQRAETREPVPLLPVEGSLPADFPRGTYYLTGPGLFSDDHGSTVHPLDGHGYLRAFEFGDGDVVKYSAKYIRTEAEMEERSDPLEEGDQWRFSYRGPFSVLKGGRRMGNVKVMKNVANTSVVRWGGRLMCMWEGGDPYEIEQGTLGTVGTVDLVRRESGCGRSATPMKGWNKKGFGEIGVDIAAEFLKPILHGVFRMPPKRLLSHYKIDTKRNRFLVLSCNAEDMLLPRSNFTFYEFDSEFNLKQKKEFVIPDQMMIHDWAFTDNHYIIVGNRIKLDLPGSMLAVTGMSPMISALSVNPSQPTSPIYLLPRFSECDDGRRDWREPIHAPSQLWVSHIGNAFEERDHMGNVHIQLHASVCSYQWFNFQKMFGYNWETGRLDPSFMNVPEGKEGLLPHLVQVSIEVHAKGTCRRCSVDRLSDQWNRTTDFPAINQEYSGRRNSYTYASSSSGSRRFLPHFPFDTVVKLNSSDGSVGSWQAGKRKFIGEPIYVARGDQEEDDGYILVVEYAVSKQRCYLVVLDAKRIGEANALVARLEVPKHLNFPLGFHGFWADSDR